MAVVRIQRLLRLVTLLQRDEPNTTETLMRTLGVSRRTLFRDLQMLAEAGVPYRHDRTRGYHIDRTVYMPPVHITVPEALGLLIVAKRSAHGHDRPMMGAAISAIYKIIGTMPDPIRKACADLISQVSIAPGTDIESGGNREAGYFTRLQRCIDEGQSCRIVYRGPAEDAPLHAVLNPYLLHYVNRAWYVLGYTDVHDEVRMLKLVRFTEIEPTGERFDRPENFSAADKLGNAWRLLPEGEEHQVVLEFSSRVATNASEVIWHPSQTHEFLEDGRCVMRFTVDGLNEIAWWVCGYADQVTVVKPPELRDKVETMLRSALKRYESPGSVEVVTRVQQPEKPDKRATNS